METADYGSGGVLGVLTPQANTTVEPELWCLLPAHWSLLNARLTSAKSTIEERLVDYTRRFEATSGQFANAPVDVIVAACTGASYLIGAERERAIVDLVQAARGVSFLTAALAAVAALRARDAKRIALLSPYPETLNAASAPYWRSHGFDIVAVAGPQPRTDRFHPIYAMQSDMVLQAYRELSDAGADAVLMLGTGMPTLRPILQGADEGLTPAVSCNLALVWAAVQKKPWTDLAEGSIADWCRGVHWRERLDTLFPLPAGA